MKVLASLLAILSFIAIIFSKEILGNYEIIIISAFFGVAVISALFNASILKLAFASFFSVIMIFLVFSLLEEPLSLWPIIALILSVCGMVFSWGMKSRKKAHKEKDAKITDFINKSSKLEKELPEELIKDIIIIEKPRLFSSEKSRNYHEEGCKIGERIAQRNRIYFKDESEAKGKNLKKHKCNQKNTASISQ
jgi:hypothetical protein